MKRIYLPLFISILFSIHSFGQILKPVTWKTSFEQISGDEYELTYTAKIKNGWTIYSQYLESDEGPVATTFTYDEGGHFALNGKNIESDDNKKTGYDKIFDMNVTKFSKKAIFKQKVKASDLSKPITGYLTYMTCDATKCLPPTDFDFEFKLSPKKAFKDKEKAKTTAAAKKEDPIRISTQKKTGAPYAEPKLTIEPKSGQGKATEIKITQPKVVSQGSAGVKVEAKKESTSPAKKDNGILKPVSWDIAIKSLGNSEHEIIYTANIKKGWTIYSQHTSDDGPVPTSFEFDSGDHFSLIGEASEEGKKKQGFDKLFETEVIKFVKGPVYFKQKVKAINPDQAITGYLTFMTCDNARCLPPADVDFVIYPNQSKTLIGAEATPIIEALAKVGKLPSTNTGIGDGGKGTDSANAATGPYPSALSNVDLKNPVGNCADVETVVASTSIWRIFILGFLGGLVALLTPCVFPMIPLTVSFFTKGSENRSKGLANAVLYGAFILMVYLALSIPFHLMDSISGDILSDISTNVWLNVAFFLIFLFFAFSFFGYYEITLPEKWTNKSSSAEGAGGILGIFFMALTLALVSFSCTGPILGSLLAGAMSSEGGAWQLTAGMGGFGLALALPFALFAAFPSMMSALPKSGGWLNTVKVVLGFLELALAFKFLSNADLVKHWGLLKVEPFLIIWILCAVGLAAYLFGFLKFPHDSPLKKLKPARALFGALCVAFAIYLGTGLTYDQDKGTLNSLSLLSGLAPPTCYSILYPCDCPNNLTCFKDIDSGLKYAKEQNKPVMIDFTGYACVNCRKMEEHVWPKKKIFNILDDDYVLISLYVDDKKDLPEKMKVPLVQGTGNRTLRNYGHKWAYMQEKYFNNNSQPYYVLLSPDLELLNTPVGYTPDVDEYEQFLKCGLESWKKIKK